MSPKEDEVTVEFTHDTSTVLDGQAGPQIWRRRLDALVAEKVFNLQIHPDQCDCAVCHQGAALWTTRVEPYSTDLVSAWKVVDRFDAYELRRGCHESGIVHYVHLSAFPTNPLGKRQGWACGDTLCRAICLSAVNATDETRHEMVRQQKVARLPPREPSGRTWVTEIPTDPGWYWWRTSPYLEDPVYWDVFYVDQRGQIPERGCTTDQMTRLCPNSEWAGPIDPPG